MDDILNKKELDFFKYNVEGYWDKTYIFVYLLDFDDKFLYTCDDEILGCTEE